MICPVCGEVLHGPAAAVLHATRHELEALRRFASKAASSRDPKTAAAAKAARRQSSKLRRWGRRAAEGVLA